MNIKKYVNICQYKEILSMTRYELAFCLAYFIIALIICTYSTPRGSIFSPDSIGYISNAENFLSTFPYYSHSTPIYQALVAICMGLGLTSAQSAGIVPIICYSLLGFPIFLIGKIISRPMTGYLSCIICLLCGKYLLWISTYVWTDMPYIFFSALTILFLSVYNTTRYSSSITFAELFTIISALTRSLGIALIPAGIIVIIGSSKGLKNTLIDIFHYSFIPTAFMILWLLMTNTSYYLNIGHSKSSVAGHPLKLSILLNMIQFKTHLERIFYIDYKPTIFVIFLFILICLIYIAYKQYMKAFVKNTVPLTSYILLYSFMTILVTANSVIMISNAVLDFRYIIAIYPYIILLIITLLIYTYDKLNSRPYKNLFKIVSIFLLICLVAQGVNALYSKATDIRTKSLTDYSDRDLLNTYISKNNILRGDVIYPTNKSNYANYKIALGMNHQGIKCGLILQTKPSLHNFALGWGGPSNVHTIEDLIKINKNMSIYIIAPFSAWQNYSMNPSKEICLVNPYKLSNSIIFRAELKNNESCDSNMNPEEYHISNNLSIKIAQAANLIDLGHDQLLISNLYQRNAKESIFQILDFAKSPPAKIEYNATVLPLSNHSLLFGDFMGLGYDQVLYLAGGKIIVDDFSQGNATVITRYSKSLANVSALVKLTDADELLAGDFMGRGHSQVMFVDRNPEGGKLVIADFSKGKAPKVAEFMEIEGNSTLLGMMLDEGDRQLSGDFMGQGHSQLMMINCNHTGTKEPKVIIADLSKGEKSALLRYQENWGGSSLFGGWLDANDTQLVGDFMGLGHSQLLLVNHGHSGGKIVIIDFSSGKPSAKGKYWANWNSGGIFEGWMGLNDTKVAGDFNGIGYCQVLFLNSSINGSDATIVEFITGKPEIAW